MGRRARPVELHLLHGNRAGLTKEKIRKRQEGEGKIRPPSDQVKPPAWLSPAGRRVWRQAVDALKNTKLLTNADTDQLAVFCDAVAQYGVCAKLIRRDGPVIREGVVRQVMESGAIVETNAGRLVQNPAVQVAAKYATIIARLGSKFGLDPSARAGLAIPKDPDDKPQDEFAKRFES